MVVSVELVKLLRYEAAECLKVKRKHDYLIISKSNTGVCTAYCVRMYSTVHEHILYVRTHTCTYSANEWVCIVLL